MLLTTRGQMLIFYVTPYITAGRQIDMLLFHFYFYNNNNGKRGTCDKRRQMKRDKKGESRQTNENESNVIDFMWAYVMNDGENTEHTMFCMASIHRLWISAIFSSFIEQNGFSLSLSRTHSITSSSSSFS